MQKSTSISNIQEKKESTNIKEENAKNKEEES